MTSPRLMGHCRAKDFSHVSAFDFESGSWIANWVATLGAVCLIDFLNSTGLPRRTLDKEVRSGRMGPLVVGEFKGCRRPVELIRVDDIRQFNWRVINGEFSGVLPEYLAISTKDIHRTDPRLLIKPPEDDSKTLCD